MRMNVLFGRLVIGHLVVYLVELDSKRDNIGVAKVVRMLTKNTAMNC